jgi:hypothetical protein
MNLIRKGAAFAGVAAIALSSVTATASAAPVPSWHQIGKATVSGPNAHADLSVGISDTAYMNLAPYQKAMRLVVTSTPKGPIGVLWFITCFSSGGSTQVSAPGLGTNGTTPLTITLPSIPNHSATYCMVDAYSEIDLQANNQPSFSSVTIKLDGSGRKRMEGKS